MESIKTINYVPKQGDVVRWNGDNYFVIENNGEAGVVNPFGKPFYCTDFKWVYEGLSVEFVRVALNTELNALGLLYKIVQDGRVLLKGTKEVCEIVSERWTQQNGNVDLEVMEC